ncbi:hypothetical protein DesyoDRAFT_3375 [Desulfosporosinus youngiae DSM 17734]|uniref:Uncharacterized protein n=2 Tax=Desulfosporosinus TaxID=79206 RepID=H5Y5F0_9FIRM|nr:hypothetical protein DesyoDRAFT_3375 [Desulfosporosinus youngiae DSM 17734]
MELSKVNGKYQGYAKGRLIEGKEVVLMSKSNIDNFKAEAIKEAAAIKAEAIKEATRIKAEAIKWHLAKEVGVVDEAFWEGLVFE